MIELTGLGNETIYSEGKNGDLKVTVNVTPDILQWRQENDIYSQHYFTLSEAYRKKQFELKTA